MNWQQLEYFKTVAETQNFTSAANLLSVTQPALSKAISKLEEELNVPLFEKNGRNIKLTRFGSMFLIHANAAINEISKGIQELQDIINPMAGTVSMSSLYTIGTHFIPSIISEFLKESPNTKFEFGIQSTFNILKGLKDGKFDFGFYDEFEDIKRYEEIESVPIKNEELVLIVPKNHHLADKTEVFLKGLKEESFVFFSEGIKGKMCSIFESIGFVPKTSIEYNESSMVVTGFVSAGLGISIVPNTPNLITEEVSVLKIKEPNCYRTVHMGWLKNGYMTPSAKIFKDFVIEASSKIDI
ncbi:MULTISPECIES: LysR family transcriptional regulator [Clostridium]|uniref:LysR family transcriptional regulator n=2 Tax=Clostridium beijerinckii TaxID=1520 RepID=A0AAW3W8C8_CLOBE|nr:LysR family transcriptional regulator [Clostridium beijerinckii]MBC2457925.1 LysR family transcriptional regulator [Clostridium beijerinckii]MBC2475152.1 LysR family transcriptional regulator [Clostridium beijerinckii]NOV61148.1 DNA-binding transcriptional LysR family regulator [Clostridium beijerinckii]NOV69359.1 DNA-binding transcriptional LysR family regulator [Clostridium beijerinckii]NOW32987.1 DNA-binding transcriptional LysR family regulator [Clostridium beijerinckii]